MTTVNLLCAVLGGFLLGWNPWARRDSKRLDWVLATWTAWDGSVVRRDGQCVRLQTRADIDAVMAAEAAHDAH